MLVHPQFDPVAIHLGPLGIHWYGLMYLVGFLGGLWLGKWRIRHSANPPLTERELDDLLFYIALGVILGGRLGYLLFYMPGYYLAHPLEILALWQGGMSFHGGFIGVMTAVLLFTRKYAKSWLPLMDFVAPLVPIGLGAGRLGNFINGELWGKPTDVPWAMIFPKVDSLPRHPSQLYEFGLEGIALFLLLWLYSHKPRPAGAVSALFLIGYGLSRFVVEFAREPDSFLGKLALGMSMGQWLSLPMILIGLWMLRWALRRPSAT
jgi:phosphatidylglycerol:prolipoprotein diacylglycerol transferase